MVHLMFDPVHQHHQDIIKDCENILSNCMAAWSNDPVELHASLDTIISISKRQISTILLTPQILEAFWLDKKCASDAISFSSFFPNSIAIKLMLSTPEEHFVHFLRHGYFRMDIELSGQNYGEYDTLSLAVRQLCAKYPTSLMLCNRTARSPLKWFIDSPILELSKDIGVGLPLLQHIYTEIVESRPYKQFPPAYLLENFNNPLCALLYKKQKSNFLENFILGEERNRNLFTTFTDSFENKDSVTLWAYVFDFPNMFQDTDMFNTLHMWDALGCWDLLVQQFYEHDDWTYQSFKTRIRNLTNSNDPIDIGMESP